MYREQQATSHVVTQVVREPEPRALSGGKTTTSQPGAGGTRMRIIAGEATVEAVDRTLMSRSCGRVKLELAIDPDGFQKPRPAGPTTSSRLS